MFKYGNFNPAFFRERDPIISGFPKNPFREKSPETAPLIDDSTSFPKGLKASKPNSSRVTSKSIKGLLFEKSKAPEAKILLAFLLFIDKSTLYLS